MRERIKMFRAETTVDAMAIPTNAHCTVKRTCTLRWLLSLKQASAPTESQPMVLQFHIDQFPVNGFRPGALTTADNTGIVTCQSFPSLFLQSTVGGSHRNNFTKFQAQLIAFTVTVSGQFPRIGQAAQQAIRMSVRGLVDAGRLAKTAAPIQVTGCREVSYSESPQIVRRIKGSGKLIKSHNEP